MAPLADTYKTHGRFDQKYLTSSPSRHHRRGDGGSPVGPGLADIGNHRGNLPVVQFLLPAGHLPQAALAALEDGGNHRRGLTQDRRIFIQGRKGVREPLAIDAMTLGAIRLKDFLAWLYGVAGPWA